MSTTKVPVRPIGSVFVLVMSMIATLSFAGKCVAPNEVILWQHSNFQGHSLSWKLEDGMRHHLVTALAGWSNDMVSSIEVGANVRVAVYRHTNFRGPSSVVSETVDSLGSYWNDEISSLIVFPRSLDAPRGVVLSEVGFNTYTSYEPAIQFFPLPESIRDTEAAYPSLGDYMNDKATHLLLQGDHLEVDVFEHSNYGGTWSLRFPIEYCWEQSLYEWQGYQAVRLGGCRAGLSRSVSSLKVRTTDTPGISTPLSAPQAVPSIGGTWYSAFGFTYAIRQAGSSFSWYLDRFHETGTGTIDGLRVTVEWTGDNGTGSDSGWLVLDSEGSVLRIEWSNGNDFHR